MHVSAAATSKKRTPADRNTCRNSSSSLLSRNARTRKRRQKNRGSDVRMQLRTGLMPAHHVLSVSIGRSEHRQHTDCSAAPIFHVCGDDGEVAIPGSPCRRRSRSSESGRNTFIRLFEACTYRGACLESGGGRRPSLGCAVD